MANQETRLSRDAYERLRQELADLEGRGRVDIARIIERARELGDLSENADYHAAKEDQGRMEGRIRQLQSILENAVVIGDSGLKSAWKYDQTMQRLIAIVLPKPVAIFIASRGRFVSFGSTRMPCDANWSRSTNERTFSISVR